MICWAMDNYKLQRRRRDASKVVAYLKDNQKIIMAAHVQALINSHKELSKRKPNVRPAKKI